MNGTSLICCSLAAAGVLVLGGCSSGSSGSSAPTTGASTSSPSRAGTGDTAASATTPTTSTSSSSAPSGSGSGAKCSDLTGAAASAAVGKTTTVTLDTTVAPLAGLTICNVTVAAEVYPIQLAVNTNGGQAAYSADHQAFSGVDLSGVGDEAFHSSIGVEVFSGGVDIKVTGPAGPVLSGNFTTPTAIAKAMVATLK